MTAIDPHRVTITRTGGLLRQRCDPYGAESQIKLMGGMFPESMRGRHMWFCERAASGRFRMVCRCQHHGVIFPLCGPGLVRAPGGEMVYHPGHIAEISRRQAGTCPRCVWPPAAREAYEMDRAGQVALADAYLRQDRAAEARAKRQMIDAGRRIDELMTQGLVHNCPLRLEEVS